MRWLRTKRFPCFLSHVHLIFDNASCVLRREFKARLRKCVILTEIMRIEMFLITVHLNFLQKFKKTVKDFDENYANLKNFVRQARKSFTKL